MKIRIILSVVIVVLGATAAILPERSNSYVELNEHQMLQEMLLSENYITVDELSDLLIDGDPSVRIIDVRAAMDYKKPIPRAINIPFDSIFSENYIGYFDQFAMKNVIYSQNDQLAVQVWMLMKQQGFKNNYLLEGGLEAWKTKILDPQAPDTSDPQEAFELYRKRLASKQYFTGSKSLPVIKMEPIAPIQRRAKKKVEGGCS